jgi:2,4-dienoyl-CoA reductase-like NADH-dependent reductase (Old Yellow Enzyme family)
MTGIYCDDLVPALRTLGEGVHALGGLVIAQINHGGMQASADSVGDPVAPSDIQADWLKRPARAMTEGEIEEIVEAYGLAALRAQRAGLDGVQIHGAHGYLVSQFLSPAVNRRTDQWGGDIKRRMLFLRRICSRVRSLVGPDYPVIIKLGLADGVEGGLALAEGLEVVSELEAMGIDAVEISAGIGGRRSAAIRPGIRTEADEAYFRSWSRQARTRTRLPILLVGGMRSRSVMEDVLASGDADLISMCRPLICEPDLPRRLRTGQLACSSCVSGDRCWPKQAGQGISCKCPREPQPA